jgi:hypothetical protein
MSPPPLEAEHSVYISTEKPTPTLHTHSTNSSLDDAPADASGSSSAGQLVVFVVTDMCFPNNNDFQLNKGTLHIDSVHSSITNANARAKKIMWEGKPPCQTDVDRVIEDVKNGLYTGIFVGGKEGEKSVKGGGTGCFARKVQVERKRLDVDEDSDLEWDNEQDMQMD